MKQVAILIFFLLGFANANAQDKHFTQFYSSPLTLNPALTGAFNGRYRVSVIYRDQWRRVLEQPFKTYAAALDVKFDINTNSRIKDNVAIGLLFFSDKVKGVDFNTNQIALSGAFHKGLDRDKKQFLTLGFQAGLAQRNINYENLTFDDQFNDLDAFDKPSSESLPPNNFSFSDFSTGINYTLKNRKGISLFAGAALHHFLTPQVSFFANDESDIQLIKDNKLLMKISGQLSAQIPLKKRISIIPRVLFAKQGPHLQFNAGTNVRVGLNDFNGNAIHIGSWVRPVQNEQGDIFIDALVLMAGFEIQSVLLGLSYDMTVADFEYRQGQGAFEFSVTYLGEYENEEILCPKF